MKTSLFIFCTVVIMSCTTDEYLLDKKTNNPVIIQDHDHSSQYRETDFNFILRAIHPSQNIDIRFGDGVRGARFQATLLAWENGKVNGHASIQSKKGWDLTVGQKITRCEDDILIVEMEADVIISDESGEMVYENWIIVLQSSSGNTDNPECLIWDIKDSDGNSQAQFQPEGMIYIDNGSCNIR
ncbi:MAG: hypothetical protein HKN68_19105 [Saprospiraceae bacterium]|nr:hypothetical protein [Saprospiraceae bacterium]